MRNVSNNKKIEVDCHAIDNTIHRFCLRGEENIERLIEFLDPNQPEPKITKKMTQQDWKMCLDLTRDEVLQEKPKNRGSTWITGTYDLHSAEHQVFMKKFWDGLNRSINN